MRYRSEYGLFSQVPLYVACSRVGNLTIYLYAQTMGQQRMLYIRKFYVVKYIYILYISVYIHRWDIGPQLQWRVTNMARNDLRAWVGAWGGGGVKRQPNS